LLPRTGDVSACRCPVQAVLLALPWRRDGSPVARFLHERLVLACVVPRDREDAAAADRTHAGNRKRAIAWCRAARSFAYKGAKPRRPIHLRAEPRLDKASGRLSPCWDQVRR